MSLIEFIGFIISMAAMIFLLGRRVWEERYRREHPEEFKEEKHKQEETLKHFLKSLDIDMEDEEEDAHPKPRMEKPAVPPPPPPRAIQAPAQQKSHRLLQQDQYKFKDKLDSYRQESQIENRKLKNSIHDRYKDYKGDRIVSPDMRYMAEAYHAIVKPKPSRANRLVNRLYSRKDMIVYQEIMNPPVGMRRPK